MISEASKVNGKLHYASVLLSLLYNDSLKPVERQALASAVLLTMQSAFRLFLQEVAATAQLTLPSRDLNALIKQLAEKGVASQAANALHGLAQDQTSWFSHFNTACHTLDAGERLSMTTANSQIASDNPFDLTRLLSELKAFISSQRAYFSEW